MKRKGRDRRVLLAGIGGVVAGSFLAAGKARAGMLEPPSGAVSATGRSLSDIEPRTPIHLLAGSASAMHMINKGGHYKLTRDLVVPQGQWGVLISTVEPVSIDLAGFSLRSSGGGGGGAGGAISIDAVACPYVEVYDGYIRDFSGDGISSVTARVLECYDLHIDNVTRGIAVSGSLIVEGCHIERCSSHGIFFDRTPVDSSVCIVDDTECRACGGHGIFVTGDFSVGGGSLSFTEIDAVGNLADGMSVDLSSSSGGGAGGQFSMRIQAVRATLNGGSGMSIRSSVSPLGTSSSLVLQCLDVVCSGNTTGMDLAFVSADLIDCVCSKNTGDGIRWGFCSGTIDACTAMDNGGDGIHCAGASSVSINDIAAHSNGGTGLHLDFGVTHSSVTDGDVRGNTTGMRTRSPGNLLLRNTALGNSVDYDLEPTTPVVIVTMAQMAQSSNPHANYSS